MPNPHHVSLALVCAASLGLGPAVVAQEVAFTDHRGAEIAFDAPPARVVTIVRSAPLIYRAIDETADHIVGQNRDSLTRYFTSGLYAELLPEMAGINAGAAQDGFVPNVEAILELNPDAVIQWTYDPDLIEPLERVGLTVVGWDCCTERNRLDYLTLTGALTGRSDRAEAILGQQDATLAALADAVAAVPEADWPSVLHIDQIGDQIQVIANGSQNLTLSGVTNPAADDTGEWWRSIDMEQLLLWNPDIIIIPAYAADLNPQDFRDDPLLSHLDAVQAGRVYKQPFFARTPDAPEIYLTSVWLAALAHGAEFAPDFRQQISDTYAMIYGGALSPAQLDAALAVEANAASAGFSDTFR